MITLSGAPKPSSPLTREISIVILCGACGNVRSGTGPGH